MTMQKTMSADFSSLEGDETRFIARITTTAVDREGDVMIPGGMNSVDFEKIPTLLYMHEDPAQIGILEKFMRAADYIDAKFVLAPRPDNAVGEWLPDTVGSFLKFTAKHGVSMGVSIRFAPLPGGVRSATKADKQKYGDGCRRVFSKWSLLEVSVVTIPMNQESIVLAVSKGAAVKTLKAMGYTVSDLAAPVKVKAKMHTVGIVVPLLGADDVASAAQRIIAKMRGQFR